MLSNGNLLGELGTSLIACIAYNFKKPVIAFCETYKFWDKILMNSIQSNNILVDQINANKKNVSLIVLICFYLNFRKSQSIIFKCSMTLRLPITLTWLCVN